VAPCLAFADFTGRVVEVSDGETLTGCSAAAMARFTTSAGKVAARRAAPLRADA
jgi:hypothetical protein